MLLLLTLPAGFCNTQSAVTACCTIDALHGLPQDMPLCFTCVNVSGAVRGRQFNASKLYHKLPLMGELSMLE